jgi:hypothetical protein
MGAEVLVTVPYKYVVKPFFGAFFRNARTETKVVRDAAGKKLGETLTHSTPGLLRSTTGIVTTGVLGAGGAGAVYAYDQWDEFNQREKEKAEKEKNDFIAKQEKEGKTHAEAEENWRKEQERKNTDAGKTTAEKLGEGIQGWLSSKDSFGLGSVLFGGGLALLGNWIGGAWLGVTLAIAGIGLGQPILNALPKVSDLAAKTKNGAPSTTNAPAAAPAKVPDPPVIVPTVPVQIGQVPNPPGTPVPPTGPGR